MYAIEKSSSNINFQRRIDEATAAIAEADAAHRMCLSDANFVIARHIVDNDAANVNPSNISPIIRRLAGFHTSTGI